MDKGIRPYCNAKFVELNNLRNRGELTNTQFRKNVMADIMEQFGITLASAATHYNHAFKTVKELNAELVSGLGRPEDKKGGRKPKAKAPVAPSVIPTPASALLQNFINCGAVPKAPAEAAPVVQTLISEGVRPHTATHTVTTHPEKTYTVTRVKDGAVVAEGLLLADAEALVAKAAAAKKAKLAYA